MRPIRCGLAIGLFVLSLHCGAAPTQEEVDAAKRTQALAEAEQATAEANKAKVEAATADARAKLGVLDPSKLSKPAGEVKTLNLENNLLAYAAADRIAARIAAKIRPKISNKAVVIFSEKEFNAFSQLQSFGANLGLLDKDFTALGIPKLAVDDSACKADDETGGGGIGALGAVDVAMQVLSLFKDDKKLEGADVVIDPFAIAAAVLDKLNASGVNKAIYPPTFFPGLLAAKSPLASTSSAVQSLNRLSTALARVDTFNATLAKKRQIVQSRIDADKTPTPACKAAYAEALQVFDSLDQRAKLLKARGDKFVLAATSPDEKTGATLLQALMAAETLSKTASDGFALQIKAVSGGGTSLIKTNFFRTKFEFSGGAVISYMLMDTDGAVVASGTMMDYGGSVDAVDINPLLPATN